MSDDRLRRIQSIFHGAMERTAADRKTYVDEACAGDPGLRDDVLSFVRHAEAASADGFMKGPAYAVPDARPERMFLAAGTRLGPYEIVDAIGAGGMGEVYRAHDSRLGRSVAIKILPSDVRKDRQFLARFEREARAIAGLNHPNICTLHDIGHDEGIDFLVMEHIEGQTLRNKLRAGPLSIDQATRIGVQVADALATAHRQGLVHRDIKPSNIIITTSGHAKVVDFGLARLTGLLGGTHPRSETTETGVVIGTPNYMSPEQARGLPLDEKTDVFSLGVVLFECLTGRLPFDGETRDEYLKQLISARPHQISEFKSDVPPGLQALVMRCLERDPSARIDAAELMHLSRAFVEGTASGLRDFSAPVPWWQRAWPILAGVLVTAVVLTAAWYWFESHQSRTPADGILRRFTTDDGDESGSQFSPDRQWLSYIKFADGARRLFVRQIDGGTAQQVKLPAGSLQSCIWSDDQKWFACAFSGKPWTIQIVPLFGSETPSKTFPFADIRNGGLLRWIGESIYLRVDLTPQGSGLERIDLNTGEVRQIEGPWNKPTVRSLDVHPVDLRVVWSESVGVEQNDLWVAGIDGSRPFQLTDSQDKSRKRYPIWMGSSQSVIFQSNRRGQIDLWQIDTVTRTMTQRSTDSATEIPESALADGSVSFQVTSEKADLWIWPAAPGAGTSVSDQSLSDFSPTASSDGAFLAFQRTRGSPTEGFAPMDADVFVAHDPKPTSRLTGEKVASGLAPAISPDGRMVAYLQRDATSSEVGLLMITPTDKSDPRQIATGLPLPSSPNALVWVGRPFAWASARDLYFTQNLDSGNERRQLMHYKTGDASRAEPVGSPSNFIWDIVATSDGRTVAHLSSDEDTKAFQVHLHDTVTHTDKVIYRSSVEMARRYVYLHGWTRDDSNLVLSRRSGATQSYDVLTLNRDGHPVATQHIDHVVDGTARLVAGRNELYVTRTVDGADNVFALPLGNGSLRPVSTNVHRDDTFGNVEPLGPNYVIGALYRKTVDINVWDARATAASGHGRR